MTNREKFIRIFGVSFEEFDQETLDCKYAKARTYKATLSSWMFWREPLTIYVNALNKKQARKKAIIALGEEYSRYRGSGQPKYKLTIERMHEEDGDE